MNTQRRLHDKVAVVTGANQGIGRAIALAFAAQGAHLVLCDLNDSNLPEIVKEAGAEGVDAEHTTVDVTRPREVEAVMGEAEQRFGRIDILANCAGIYHSRRFLDYPLEDWNHLMNVNLTGTFLCCQAALRRMVPRRSGKIINLASVAGRMGGPFRAGYAASKHAVIGLTRCVALEFAEHGINANAICPGMVDTDMFEGVVRQEAELLGVKDTQAMLATMLKRSAQQRLIRPEEIALLAVYLASPESDGMTGQAVTLSGGMVMQ